MPSTRSKPSSPTTAPVLVPAVRKATAASVLNQPKASTAEALKGFHYLRSQSSRSRSSS